MGMFSSDEGSPSWSSAFKDADTIRGLRVQITKMEMELKAAREVVRAAKIMEDNRRSPQDYVIFECDDELLTKALDNYDEAIK